MFFLGISKCTASFFCHFFFQAEDGIRDRTVTGVQTCALPICGYLMGFQLAMGSTSAGLNERYDLIGFDPRGVGYSTKVNCPPPEVPPGDDKPPPGPVTEAVAK